MDTVHQKRQRPPGDNLIPLFDEKRDIDTGRKPSNYGSLKSGVKVLFDTFSFKKKYGGTTR